MDLLRHCFSLVCGQNPDHTWCPGGLMLPFCQRCTGLYLGAFVAAGLYWLLRPGLTNRLLWVHGLFLLAMAPLGFHWLPHGPFLRGLSGFYFGAALVTFLVLPLRKPDGNSGVKSGVWNVNSGYWLGLAITGPALPLVVEGGGRGAAFAMIASATAGALVLGALACRNAFVAISTLGGFFSNRRNSARV